MLRVKDVFADLPNLETERLVMRKISIIDANDVFAMPGTTKFLGMCPGIPTEIWETPIPS